MAKRKANATFYRLISDYGMLLVLLLLCAYYSYVTWAEQHPGGVSGANQLAEHIVGSFARGTRVMIVARDSKEDVAFADTLEKRLREAGLRVVDTVKGHPIDARRALQKLVDEGQPLHVIACNHTTGGWAVFDRLASKFPSLAGVRILTPRSYWWPNFLKADNLLNVANQIVVIAMIAIGMTMVIITAGIDLSVGSLIALSAVVATLLIRDAAGAEEASGTGMLLCCLAAIVVCAMMGMFSGTMVTAFRIPPFIVTLGMMLVASGLAYIFAQGQSVYQVPDSFVWLGRGVISHRVPSRLLTVAVIMGITFFVAYAITLALSLFLHPLVGRCKFIAAGVSLAMGAAGFLIRPWPIPVAVLLMGVLYVIAHVLMTRTRLGRYIYAVGGNAEAARLSGVPVKRVVLFVYTFCGALAGLGGVVMASQLRSGSPTYGQMYELYVIAAVVVGGTSLSGGEGKVLGTLIGAFIIAVIQNGMNLTGVESYTQKVVLGLVILGAVLLDKLKKRRWRIFRRK